MKKPISKAAALVRPWTPWLIMAGLIAVLVGFIDQMVPLLVRSVVNGAFAGKGGQIEWRSVATLVGLLAASQMLRVTQRLATEWPATRIQVVLFRYGMHHLLSYPMTWFAANHSGAVQVRLERSTVAVTELIKMGLSDILPPLLGLVLSARLLWEADATVGAAVVIVIPLFVTLTLWQARSQAGIRVAINSARESQGVRVAEAVQGIEQVKLFRAEAAEAERAGAVALALADREYGHHRSMALFDLGKLLTDRAGFAAVLVLGVLAALRSGNNLGPGGVLMLVMLFDRITEPVRHLHRILDQFNEKWILARDYLRLLDVEPVARMAVANNNGGDRSVVCEGVTFAYSDSEKPSVANISLCVPSGAKVALVGSSGSGKSTLAKLIAGLYRPTTGRITVGGQEVVPIEAAGAGASVGMLTQDIYIFADTIMENIRYGRPNATDREVREAAEIAGLASLIASRNDGYDMRLGQRGTGLSGGQKQRLALARVVLQNPDVIIFDEPSAALDAENARRFFDTVLSVFAGKTVLVITHDLTRLDWADQIVVMADGQVLEIGFLDELCTKNTAFRCLRDGDPAATISVTA
jgi:ABC-type multidrug transport system fused ATPase/permease subunit